MDVEGEELSVLQGGEEVIRANRPIFCIELHSTQLAKDCIEFLRSHGYRVTELDRQSDTGARSGASKGICK